MNDNNRSRTNKCFTFTLSLLFAACAIVGMVFGLAGFILWATDDATSFKLYEPGVPLPSHSLNPTTSLSSFDDRVYISLCTNQTITTSQSTTFSGTTIVMYNCPVTNNPCSQSICSAATGRCETTLNSDAECDSDFSCGPMNLCNNATCECQPIPGTTTGCIIDSDCTNVEDRNDCVTEQCIMGRCVEVTLGSCWFDGQCTEIDPKSSCNITSCNCFTEPQCFTAADCPNPDPDNMCFVMTCQNGDCIPDPIVECWQDEQCVQPTEFCNTTGTCGCQARQPVVCQAPNLGCPILQGVGSCSEFTCLGGECIEELVGLSECSKDTNCDQPSEFCNIETCTCDPVPIQGCELDSHCTNITDRGPCVENQCINGTCTEVTLGECWYSGTCPSGFSCDQSSCMCVSDASTCLTGYDMRELPPEETGLNLMSCGYDVSIAGNFSEVLCFEFQDMGSETWTIVTYIKNDDTWTFASSILTTVTFEGTPPDDVAFIEANDQDMVFQIARFFDTSFPQTTRVDIYQILTGGFLSLITTINLPQSNITEICLAVSGTDILAVNGDAYFYIQTSPSTWTLNQTISEHNNGTWFDCDLFENSMVLSTLSSSVMGGETWYSYLYNEMTNQWDNIGVGMNSEPSNENWYVEVLQNNLKPDDDNSFTVVSSISSYSTSTIQVFNAGAMMLSSLQFITSSGPGKMRSFERNIVISDTLFRGGIGDGLSFQSDWEGFYPRANDLYIDQPIFSVVNESGGFLVFVNWCPEGT